MIQSTNNIELFQHFWSSRSLFQILNLFRNWFRLWNHLECFIDWNSCRKKHNFCKPIKTMKWIVELQSMSSLHEKNIGNQFRLCSNLKNKKKFFTAEAACLKASTFSQTEPVDGMNWFTSKLQSSNSLLEVSKFLQTDPVYELNWNSSKFQISKSSIKKIRLFKIWFSL